MEIHAVKFWADSHNGVVQLDGDVLGVVQQVKALSDNRIKIYYNPQSNGFDLVELCLDGAERLVFSVDTLDGRVVERLHQADHWGAPTPDRGLKRPEGQDFLDEMDTANEELEAARHEASLDKVGDAGERLAWALDAVKDAPSVKGSIHVKKDIHG